jgi:hypothetical protein
MKMQNLREVTTKDFLSDPWIQKRVEEATECTKKGKERSEDALMPTSMPRVSFFLRQFLILIRKLNISGF